MFLVGDCEGGSESIGRRVWGGRGRSLGGRGGVIVRKHGCLVDRRFQVVSGVIYGQNMMF